MKHMIKYLPSAQEDLKSIEDWCEMNFDAQNALRVTDSIVETIQRLEHFPESGSFPRDEWGKQQGFRLVFSGRHVAIYKVIDESVYIYHIADTRTAYNRLFYQA